MELLRQRLVGRIDDFLLQIEASLVLPHNIVDDSTRVLLDTFDIDQLRSLLISSGNTPTRVPLEIQGASERSVRDNSLSETVSPNDFDAQRVENHDRHAPKRRKQEPFPSPAEQSAVDKLIEGIFEQIHNPKSLVMDDSLTEAMQSMLERVPRLDTPLTVTQSEFENITKCCRDVTVGGRVARVLEVMIQAYWVDYYDARLASLKAASSELRAHEHKRLVLTEACTTFTWSEKELRNRMAIWKGYREIKNAAGWSALVFAGPGIYRFCKYRLGFDRDSITKLENLRTRAEVAADTLQAPWRKLLSLIGDAPGTRWQGHPHDWTVSMVANQEPLPLAVTYRQWDLNFSFEHLQESVIDIEQWHEHDPRKFEDGPDIYCKSCSLKQSACSDDNECECFPDLYSPNARLPCPVQIFRTENGKNNGLIACCSIDPGRAVGEFIGLITKGLADVDVMQSQAGDNEPYQIWQGRRGNFTRFMNHSCAPNCQFQTFSWLGVQRIVVVSKGIAAGEELTVDYSARYWDNLDKICLCGETCCRYKDRSRGKKRQSIDLPPLNGFTGDPLAPETLLQQ